MTMWSLCFRSGPFALPSTLIILLCFSVLASIKVDAGETYAIAECGRVIKANPGQTMECLNVSNISITSPIVLESTVEDNGFICPNRPPLYTFRCTLFGDDLIWLFNNTRVTAFLNDDRVGRIYRIHYPDSDPVYNITTVLTQVLPFSRSYNTPYCVSIMTVEAYDETIINVEPFTVSCQSFCNDRNNTAVCQTRHYNVAAQPSRPMQVSGSIRNISATADVASISWTPPKNENETVLRYYNVTLIGSHTNNSMLIDKHATYLYTFGVSDLNYNAASVAAVDMCGQSGEPLQSVLNLTSSTGTFSDPTAIGRQQPVIHGLAAAFAIMSVATIGVLAAFIAILIIYVLRRGKPESPPGSQFEEAEL